MIIQTRNIQKSFGNLQVLKGIDFDVESGEVVSIVGKSGAGKTTFLQIMGTLMNADEGELKILDTDIRSLKEKELAKFRNEHIGFVFQFHQLLPEFTALENVCIPAMLQGKSLKQSEAHAKELFGTNDAQTFGAFGWRAAACSRCQSNHEQSCRGFCRRTFGEFGFTQ